MLQSAGIIIVDKTPEGGPTVLAVRAYAHWDFPKGMLEPEETLVDAATRETAEEVSLHSAIDYVLKERGPVIYRGAGKKKKEITYYLAERVSDNEPFLPVSPELGKPENDEYAWVPLHKLHTRLRGPFAETICHYLNKQYKNIQ